MAKQRTTKRLSTALIGGLALALFAAAPVAEADYDPLGSGATKLTLDRSFLALAKENGVKLSAATPAKLKGGVLSFPVSGGKFDPTASKGVIDHEGALLFKANGKSVPIKALQLKTTQKHSPLSAKVGGSQLKLASAKRLVVSRAGFGNRVEVFSLALSAKLATRLGKKLRLKGVFQAGQPLGYSQTTASPLTVALLGKSTASLTLDPGIAAKLGSLFVAVNPIFPAEHPGAAFTLPIFGGTLALDGSAGTLETSGSLELLQLGGGQVFFAESWLDLGAKLTSAEVNIQPSPPYAGKAGRNAIAALSLDGAVVAADSNARTISVQSAALSLAPLAADSFNQAFAQGKPVFVAGEPLGTASFTAQGQ